MDIAQRAADVHDEFLRTDHLKSNLKGRSIKGGIVTLSAQAIKLASTILSTAILARLLTPSDFGLVAMITAVTGLLSSLKDAGLATPTIQRAEISHAQVSNLFWINVGVSAVFTLLVAAAAPLIVWLYRSPQLLPLTLALAVTFFIDGLSVQHLALLSRQMKFASLARIEVGALLFGQLAGIGCAAAGCGAWSLVAATLATSLCGMVLAWSTSRWRPQMPKRGSGTRPLVSFGASLTAANSLSYLVRNVDNFLIGRMYGATTVGLYSRAAALLRRPVDQLLGPVTAVVQPTLSRLQNEPERYRRTFMQLFEFIALVALPVTGAMAALARPVVLVLLGPKWEAAAVLFAAFSIVTLYSPLACSAFWIFESQGRGWDMFRSNSYLSTLAIISFVVGLPFGAAGVALSFSISGLLVRLPILFHIAGGKGPVTRKDLWLGFLRHLWLWPVVYFSTRCMLHFCPQLPPFLQILVAMPVGLACAAAFVLVYPPQRRVAARLWETVKSVIVARSAEARK